MKLPASLVGCCLAWTASAATPRPESAGLVAHWSFDRDFTSAVNHELYDAQPRGGSLVQIDRAVGAAKIGTGAARIATDPQRRPAFLAIATPPWGLQGNDVFTLAGWFKLADVNGDGMPSRSYLWESVPNSATNFSIGTARDTRVAQFRFRSENARTFQGSLDSAVSLGQWHHVAVVWSVRARHLRVYFDGQLAREMPLNDADRLEPIRGLNLGGNKLGDGAADWDGWLDDLAIFDVELTARQIAALAEAGEVTATNVLARIPEPETQRLRAGNVALSRPPVPADETTTRHVGERDAILWARIPQPGEYAVTARADDGTVREARAEAKPENDWCLHWRLTGLEPLTRYSVTFTPPAGSRTAPPAARVPHGAAGGAGRSRDARLRFLRGFSAESRVDPDRGRVS